MYAKYHTHRGIEEENYPSLKGAVEHCDEFDSFANTNFNFFDEIGRGHCANLDKEEAEYACGLCTECLEEKMSTWERLLLVRDDETAKELAANLLHRSDREFFKNNDDVIVIAFLLKQWGCANCVTFEI